MLPRLRSEHDETHTADAQPGFQGEGGAAAINGEKTLAELANLFDCPPSAPMAQI